MTIPRYLQHLFDVNYIKRNTPNYNNLRVTLKRIKSKGVGLVATKDIPKGSLIAYYRMTVYNADTYKSPTHNAYTFTIYTKNGNESQKFIGDLSPASWSLPCGGVPYWAYFSNEPSATQRANSRIDENIAVNYRNRNILREGDTVVYKLLATRDIRKGDEIIWCYGDMYIRAYVPNC
jgi:hypothetical protein